MARAALFDSDGRYHIQFYAEEKVRLVQESKNPVAELRNFELEKHDEQMNKYARDEEFEVVI